MTIEARSGLPFDHTNLDDTRVLTWLNRRHAALGALLVPCHVSPGTPHRLWTPQAHSQLPPAPLSLWQFPTGTQAYIAVELGSSLRPAPRLAMRLTATKSRAGRPGWGDTGSPSAWPELTEWVLVVLVEVLGVSATSETSGETVRESYSLRSSTVRPADGVSSGRFPSMTGLNQASGSNQVIEATQDPPGTPAAGVGEDEGTRTLAPSSVEGLEAGPREQA